MENLDTWDYSNKFKETIETIKQYINKLLKRKTEKVKEEVKKEVSKVIEEEKKPKTFLQKMKDLLMWDNPEKEKPKENKQELHPEDQDEYVPQNSEFWESIWEKSRFAEIFPWILWYLPVSIKSYFDPDTNLWSSKKRLTALTTTPDINSKSYQYAWVLIKWTINIPLPKWAIPDINSICYTGKSLPIFQIDQNNCIYLISNEKQHISFSFYANQSINENCPINEDSDKIIYSKLTKSTSLLINNLVWTNIEKAELIKKYIQQNKKYSTKVQWTLREKSDYSDYITNIDKSPILECFSANILLVALCREIWIPARLVTWYMVQSLEKDGKWYVSKDNWHAWSEIWDNINNIWIRVDSTPTEKEDNSSSGQNMDSEWKWDWNKWWQWKKEQSSSGSEWWEKWWEKPWSWEWQNPQGQWESSPSQEWWEQSWWEQSWWTQSPSSSSSGKPSENKESWIPWWNNDEKQSWNESSNSNKSPKEALDELLEKAKDDSVAKQAEQMKEVLEKLERAESKEEIREILNKSWLEDFAKEIIDKVWNEEILTQEKTELSKITDEKELNKALNNSLLDNEFKDKLREYVKIIKKQIEAEKKKMKSEMDRMWFKEEEIRLYKQYKELERELEPEVKKQIKELEKILPPKFRIEADTNTYYLSWWRLWGTGKLIEHLLTWDPKVFQRNKEVRNSNEINMFETIIIDRSGSMWNFIDTHSPLRETVKASIIRAKVLEYFKVNFSILLFDTELEEIMEFWEKFSHKWRCLIPSKLMRAVLNSWWTDIGKPLTYALNSMKEYCKQNWLKSFWNISFLWDWMPSDWLSWEALKWLINQIRSSWYWLTAYYINWSNQSIWELQWYFWDEKSWWTVVVPNVKELTVKLIWSYNNNLRKVIRKYAT